MLVLMCKYSWVKCGYKWGINRHPILSQPPAGETPWHRRARLISLSVWKFDVFISQMVIRGPEM